MNIVIPMAGEGRRFADAGYTVPKPLIEIAGRRMIDLVVGCLAHPGDEVTLVSRFDVPGYRTVIVGPTQGAADTLLHAPLDDGPVLVANCDQYVYPAEAAYFRHCCEQEQPDAAVMTFNSTNPHHSYVKTASGYVTDIAEKRLISDEAVLGVYWFRDAPLLKSHAGRIVQAADRVNGEFYISAILAAMVKWCYKLDTYEVDVHDKHMLGTPEELRIFEDKVADGRVVL